MTLELRMEDSGSRQSVVVGDILSVRLAETPTTGFRWQPSYDEHRLRLVGDRFEGAQEPRGAGGERVFEFELMGDEPAQLRIVKVRSWEGTVREEFTVQLEPGG